MGANSGMQDIRWVRVRARPSRPVIPWTSTRLDWSMMMDIEEVTE